MKEIFDMILNFMASLYTPSLFLFTGIGLFMKVLRVHQTPYRILGFLTTRKFAPAKNYHKYAIIIPGRNEEPVIGNLIRSIQKQDYPQEMLTIFVVADNCTDNTAQVARDLGAVCYEHHNPEERTKGFALRYLFDQIEKDYGIESFEGYFIFDADNLLKSDYISRMNDSFDAGEKIITSYRSTKNLREGWVSSLYAIHWLRSIRFRHRPRAFLHLATNIQGTGYLFTNEIVRNGWNYTSLTEDRALTADCVVNGYEISYNNDAIFYDEQPTSIKVALRQRLRWAKGHIQAFVESGWGLFRNIFWDEHTKRQDCSSFGDYLLKTLRHRFMSFDTFSQLIPSQVVNFFRWFIWNLVLYSFFVTANGSTLALFKNSTWLSRLVMHYTGNATVTIQPGFTGWLTCFGILLWIRLFYRLGSYTGNIWVAVYIFIVEHKRMEHVGMGKTILYCLTWPVYDIIERYVKFFALFMKVEWKPIPHNSTITIEDLQ